MKAATRKTVVAAAIDVSKNTVANLVAFIIAAGGVTAAWVGMGGPLPASDVAVKRVERQVAENRTEIDKTQIFILNDKLQTLQRDLRDTQAAIRTYQREGEPIPPVYSDHEQTLLGLIADTKQRLRILGVQP